MMWTVQKVETKPKEKSGPGGFKTISPAQIEVPKDEVWTFVGLEQSCGGQPCKLVFMSRPADEQMGDRGGTLYFDAGTAHR